MADTQSTSETGHYKNVATFKLLIAYISTLSKYNPARNALSVGSLNGQYTTAETAMKNLHSAEANEKNTGNLRSGPFNDLPAFGTRIVNELELANPNSPMLPAAHHIVNKMNGIRITKIVTPPTPEDGTEAHTETVHAHSSTSQRGFDAMLDHFDKLIETVEADPAYTTNIPELIIGNLHTQLDVLTGLNDAANIAGLHATTARLTRQQLLYTPVSGIVPTALTIKKAVLTAYGSTSPEYKYAHGISFHTLN